MSAPSITISQDTAVIGSLVISPPNAPEVTFQIQPAVASVSIISALAAGPRGLPGLQGDPGEQGEPGSAANTVTFTQDTPSDTWVIEHNLGKYPNVVVINSAGDRLVGVTEDQDLNNLTIYFSAAFSGIAQLS